MEACKPLSEYSWFVEKVREHCKEASIETAVSKTLGEMDDSYVIKPFLRIHMAEVASMLLAENQEINALELVGRAERKEGRKEAIQGTISILRDLKHSDEEIEKAICDKFDLKPEEVKKYLKN